MGGAQAGRVSPYVLNPEAWDGVRAKCTSCFPKDIRAQLPCLPQCVFTPKGEGAPPVMKRIFEGKEPPDQSALLTGPAPWFVVAYGPSGSGKSSILQVLRNLTDVQLQDKNVIEVNVDSLFQKDKDFEHQMAEIQQAESKGEVQPDPMHAQRLYYYYRWVADQISDAVLNQALAHRFHVLWETTGERIGWIQRELARIRSLGYRTLLVYPLVSPATLSMRVARRAKETGQVAATEQDLARQSVTAQDNLVDFLEKTPCPVWVKEELRERARQCHPDRVVLYTNEPTPALLYDSDHPEDPRARERLQAELQRLSRSQRFLDFFAHAVKTGKTEAE